MALHRERYGWAKKYTSLMGLIQGNAIELALNEDTQVTVLLLNSSVIFKLIVNQNHLEGLLNQICWVPPQFLIGRSGVGPKSFSF